MATISSPLGAIKGKVGGLRFSKSLGKNIVASQPSSYQDANTQTQQDNRQAFKGLGDFLRLLISAIRIGFAKAAVGMSAWAKALSVNYAAVSYSGGTLTITYSSIKLALGNLLGFDGLTIEAGAGESEVDITWNDNTNGTTGLGTDILCVGWYCPTTNASGFVQTAVTRADGASGYTLDAGAGQSGELVHVWPFFKAAASNSVCDSGYGSATTV